MLPSLPHLDLQGVGAAGTEAEKTAKRMKCWSDRPNSETRALNLDWLWETRAAPLTCVDLHFHLRDGNNSNVA